MTLQSKSAFAIVALGCALLVSAGVGAQQTPPANPLDNIPEKMGFDIPYGPPITLERAQAAIAAAVAEAKKHDWKFNIAVMDSGGNLVAFQRMDGAQLSSILVSQHKALSAVLWRRETKVFESRMQQNDNYILTLDNVVAARGGVPLMEGGKIVGSIGCSGGTGSQDEVACKAGAATLK